MPSAVRRDGHFIKNDGPLGTATRRSRTCTPRTTFGQQPRGRAGAVPPVLTNCRRASPAFAKPPCVETRSMRRGARRASR